MRILLISSITSYKYGNTGLDFIARHIRDNSHDTVDIKYYHHHEDYEQIVSDLNIKKYDIYGFSVYETNYTMFKEISRYIKRKNEGALIVFGGHFVTMNYECIIKDLSYVDYYILGDGESPMMRIIEHHKNNKFLLMGDKNIITKNEYKHKSINIEYDVNRPSSYDYYEYDTELNNMQKTHCILTKTNICAGACTFCCSRKGKAIYKNSDRIISEVEYLARTYKVRKFFFCDDDIFDVDSDQNRNRLNELFDRISSLNMNLLFTGFTKAISVCNPLNQPILKKMNDIGFHHLFVGLDAGNENDRLLYNKRSSLQQGVEAINILKNIGISPRFGMIFFNPYSSLIGMKQTYQYLLQLHSSNYYHYGGLCVQLLSGTKLLEKVKNDGLLKKEYSFIDTQKYNFLNNEVESYVNFLQSSFIPRADKVKYQFNTLKRIYEMVKHINPITEQYSDLLEHYENLEFNAIKDFFYFMYEKNDLDYCKVHLDAFILQMERNAAIYKPIIKNLNDIFINTPMEK